jgi:hypothetical protein
MVGTTTRLRENELPLFLLVMIKTGGAEVKKRTAWPVLGLFKGSFSEDAGPL